MIHIRYEIFNVWPIQNTVSVQNCADEGLDSLIIIHVKYMLYLTYHKDWLKYIANQKNHIIEMTN